MKLEFANLMYGSRHCKVVPSVILPIPEEFDLNNPDECAKHIFAVMSNASGGLAVRNCKYRILKDTVNLTGDGVWVFYGKPGRPKKSVEEVIKELDESIYVKLGTVRSTQYGYGWENASWTSN